MSSTVLTMSMSLDGFVAGPNASPENGLGDGGERLHEWLFPVAEGGVNEQVYGELLATGAVVAGTPTFEPAGGWGGDHHDGVPIFIVSRRPAPDWTSAWPLVRYVDDVELAVREATAAAGERDVLLHGATLARLALDAGVLDEIVVHVVPVLLGSGVRLADGVGGAVELERIRVLEGEDGITHLRYRVLR